MTYEKGQASGPKVPNCYTCGQDGHYANQCPTKDKGKALVVNMVMAEVQQVSTRSKAKQSEWDIQEEVWLTTTMLQENTGPIIRSDSQQADTSTNTNVEDNEVWQALIN